ncbi:MAG: flagellar basal body rod C-terminal domain-containing protein, partial [Gammaproteobacteria bacterium]|nr:flagellar basal body rod C-terminal domain-containing protein [Gammaproteobacteria bacterium]
ITQIDNLLAGDKSNLALSLNKFFGAVNESANDPGSLLGRQLLLTETKLLVDNFKQLENRLMTQNQAINTQLNAVATNVSGIGKQIAELNRAISDASGGGTRQLPNDLLDKRDQLVRELSRYVEVSTLERDDGSIDVAIGQGQPLVIGATTRELVTMPGSADPSRRELAFKVSGNLEPVGNLLTGGELGGLMRYRKEALDPAFNGLGRIALAITDSVNQQHKLGIDLEGNLGRTVFGDINTAAQMRDRVREYATNSPAGDRRLSVSIDDIGQLTTSDYELSFSGPGGRYSLVRLSDGKLMSQGLLGPNRPQSIEVDGFSINLESGTFNAGDRFRIQPTRSAAGSMTAQISRPEEFAFASPIRTSSAAGNQGGAYITAGPVSDVSTNAFTAKAGALSPPILIRFTSTTTYDVLDYSNPSNPVPLIPPLMNQSFMPGSLQPVFPTDPGGTTVSTLGAAAAALQIGHTTNGYPQETITILTTDPKTGFITEQFLTLNQHQSASETAARLSALTGVTANASSQMLLSEFRSGSGGEPLTLSLNGVALTDPTFVPQGQNTAEEVPNPLTADFLRDRINNNVALKAQGIFAISNGEELTIRSSTGVDLQIAIGGADGSVAVGEAKVPVAGPAAPGDPDVEFTIGGRVDVQLAANAVLTSNTGVGLFGTSPTVRSNYMGYQVLLGSGGSGGGGEPRTGDSFVVSYNSNGSADNRNGSALLALGAADLLSNGNLSIQGAYGQLVEELGILTSQMRLSQSASESMLRQSLDALSSVSGVNIEEEAARLIEFEQYYNASARLIGLARDLFDTLLNM